MTTKIHIGRVRELHLDARIRVQLVLGWDHEAYTAYQFQQYCQFGESVSEGWREVRESLLYSAIFRGFWVNEWAHRDLTEFLPMAENNGLPSHNLSEYKHINHFITLVEDAGFMTRYSKVLDLMRNE